MLKKIPLLQNHRIRHAFFLLSPLSSIFKSKQKSVNPQILYFIHTLHTRYVPQKERHKMKVISTQAKPPPQQEWCTCFQVFIRSHFFLPAHHYQAKLGPLLIPIPKQSAKCMQHLEMESLFHILLISTSNYNQSTTESCLKVTASLQLYNKKRYGMIVGIN